MAEIHAKERCPCCHKPMVAVGGGVLCCVNQQHPHAWDGMVGLNGAAVRLAVLLRDQIVSSAARPLPGTLEWAKAGTDALEAHLNDDAN